MTNVIKNMRRLESSLTEGYGRRVCPNCYFIISGRSSLTGHYICPCYEFSLESDFKVNSSAPVVEDNLELLI